MKDKTAKYNHKSVETKWQGEWEKTGLYSPDIKNAKNPFYNLWMFPYPSAEGVHVGTIFSSTGSDIYGRYRRMRGKDVFQPMGYDSFGIHSENYALKIGEPPQVFVDRAIKNYQRQFQQIGHGYDWTRTVITSDPDYYRWTQWLFIQMFKAGLAYKKKAPVNFCPSCKTVLADEQVVNGECERCQSRVGKKQLEQWFFKITDYADRLLAGLTKINWSQRVVTAQRNWIGKSEGMIIKFPAYAEASAGRQIPIEVFTTRPDTLNAATFLATSEMYEEGSKEKKGEFTGKYAISPLNGRKIPIWDTNYVAPDYGTGIIMGVPAHDERDLEFAKKYHIDVLNLDPDMGLWEKIEKEGWGKRRINYHLRDWLVSRQRYWGAPIPMVYCQKCKWEPVDEKDLPVLLPDISDYKPEGTGKGPLANHPDFYQTRCPDCGGKARRETDVLDTFVDSSWYFLRYPSTRCARSGQVPFDKEITKKWLPVDLYFGGAEHSVLHLMYSRFVTMALHDWGFLEFEEPFPRFFAHGLMIKDGAKMSKSRGNVVNPDEYIAKYGADALRLYLVFMGPMDGSPDFRDTGIEGMRRFIDRLWRAFNECLTEEKTPDVLITKLHQTIKKVTEDMEKFGYNTAIAAVMELLNLWEDEKRLNKEDAKLFVKLLAPFAPHLAEEVFQKLQNSKTPKFQTVSVHKQLWPAYNPKLIIEENATVVVQVNGKVRGQIKIKNEKAKSKNETEKTAKKEQRVSQYLKGQQIKKVVFVPGRLINFVV